MYIQPIKNRLIKSSIVKNAFWIIIAQIVQMLLSLFVGALAARYLGPDNYGELNYTATFVSFFMTIVTLGMDGVVMSKIVKYPEKEYEIIGSSLIYRVICSIFCEVFIIVIIYYLNPNENTKLILASLQSTQLVFISLQIIDVWFQKRLLSKYTSIIKIIASFAISLYKLYLLYSAKSIYYFAITNSLKDCLISLGLLILFFKNHTLTFSFSEANGLLKESYHFVFVDVLSALYLSMDKIMIGKMLSDYEVGLYTASTTISLLWVFIPSSIITSLQPSIFAAKDINEKLYKAKLYEMFSLVIYICLFFSLIITFFSKTIILFLYGEAYKGAAHALKIVIWAKFFAVISTCRSVWILCEKKNRYVKNYVFVGTICNLILNLIFIPRIGVYGAALATLTTEFINCIFSPILFKETREITRIVIKSFDFRYIVKIINKLLRYS